LKAVILKLLIELSTYLGHAKVNVK
jgi:hypothetical protein